MCHWSAGRSHGRTVPVSPPAQPPAVGAPSLSPSTLPLSRSHEPRIVAAWSTVTALSPRSVPPSPLPCSTYRACTCTKTWYLFCLPLLLILHNLPYTFSHMYIQTCKHNRSYSTLAYKFRVTCTVHVLLQCCHHLTVVPSGLSSRALTLSVCPFNFISFSSVLVIQHFVCPLFTLSMQYRRLARLSFPFSPPLVCKRCNVDIRESRERERERAL